MVMCSEGKKCWLACAVLACAAYAPAIVWDNPNNPSPGVMDKVIGLWHFNDSSSQTTVNDAGNNNYDMTISSVSGWGSGTSWGTTANGYLAAAGNYYATRGEDINIDWTKGLTVSFWFRGDSTMADASHNYAFYMGADSSWKEPRSKFEYIRGWSGNSMNVELRSGSNSSDDEFADDTWHHMALVYTYQGVGSGSVSCYLDNALHSTFSSTDNTVALQMLAVGIDQGLAANRNWHGDIDEVLIYNGVISDFSDGFTGLIPEPNTGLLFLLAIGLLRFAAGKNRTAFSPHR